MSLIVWESRENFIVIVFGLSIAVLSYFIVALPGVGCIYECVMSCKYLARLFAMVTRVYCI